MLCCLIKPTPGLMMCVLQLISLGADHVVKVWDLRNQKCLQTIAPKDWGPSAAEDSHPTCLAYDTSRQRLVSAVRTDVLSSSCCPLCIQWPVIWMKTMIKGS